MSFESLGLSPALLRAVAEQGYTQPTPIQGRVIPVVLEGRDVMAGAQTGTGKTAGFTLPMLQRLMAAGAPNGPRRVRALILTPTRELAAQVGESVRDYGKHVPLKSAVIFGGVSINPQIDAAASRRRHRSSRRRAACSITRSSARRSCGTSKSSCSTKPTACSTWASCPTFAASSRCCRSARQNLLFSATFPDDIRKLANKLLAAPVSVEVGQRNAAAEKIEQAVYFADKGQKRGLLSWLIGSGNWRQVLVFTRTKHGANRLAEQLMQRRLSAAAIHGNKSQGARTRALADFKQGTVRVLVATDIAARGLDIDQLPHVVNYDLPEVARALCPPHRPHGPRGQRRPRGVARRARRAAAIEIHRAIARARTAGPVARGLHARPAAPRAAATRASSRAPRLATARGNNDGRADSNRAAMAVGTATAAAINAAARARRAANSAATVTDLAAAAAAIGSKSPVSRATCSHA